MAHLLGGAVLLLSFVLLYQRRIGAVISAFAVQGTLLGASPPPGRRMRRARRGCT